MDSEERILPARLASLGYRTVPHPRTPAIVPPLVTIPAGPFQMGSDPRHDPLMGENEAPAHMVSLLEFQIATYPLTVAEYALAVRAGAVRAPQDFGEFSWQWQEQRTDYPVSFVSWLDAMRYIAWLVAVTGQNGWRLPTEAEWEKAARWDPDAQASRRYPWGYWYDANRCNAMDTIGQPTPVASYPAGDPAISGASPYGVEDMAGNVLEWVSSRLERYPYVAHDGREDRGGPIRRVIRGGWWGSPEDRVRGASRGEGQIDESWYCGFRLAWAQVW